MVTCRQRLARIAGAFTTGFGTGAAITMPFDPDFGVNLLKAGFAGVLTALPQLKKILEEYSRQR